MGEDEQYTNRSSGTHIYLREYIKVQLSGSPPLVSMSNKLELSWADCPSDTEAVRSGNLTGSLRGLPFKLKQLLPWPRRIVPPFPYELYVAIISLYIDAVINVFHVRQYRLGHDISTQSHALVQVMLASSPFGDLVCHEWNKYWPVLIPKRWLLARPIVYFEIPFALAIDLSPFTRLRFVSLPFNEAFEYRDNTWRILPFIAILPPGLQEIEFLWCHNLETEIIALVKVLCPTVTTIRIVPCGLFNNPSCLWWSGHQETTDHAHYMRGHELVDAENYARTISLSLPGLSCLERLHLGVYFAPFEAVVTHRSDHVEHHTVEDSTEWFDGTNIQNNAHFNAIWNAKYPNLPPPNTEIPRLADQKLWMSSCPRCVEEWSTKTEQAERLVASFLAIKCWSLKNVSFCSFVADKRIDPSEWEVCRAKIVRPPSAPIETHTAPSEYPEGTLVYVRTKRPGTPCAEGRYLIFRWSGTDWDCVSEE
ncbi:F-box-like domain-containing protein [Ceratobasidium sp. AG-Ba]|nr:F-box-like domain-containing protein [Ceratobasidium sp. AG-Ba]